MPLKSIINLYILPLIVIIISYSSCKLITEDVECFITNPQDSSYIVLGEKYNIFADISDSTIKDVAVAFYDNSRLLTIDSTFPYNYLWNAGIYPEKEHQLKIMLLRDNKILAKDSITVFTSLFNIVDIEGGEFLMGCDTCDYDEAPSHKVVLGSFSLSEKEITNIQYCYFLNYLDVDSSGKPKTGWYYILMNDDDTQIRYKNGLFVPENGKENYPVTGVTWFGANSFCKWAGGRLPSEAEWEYAATQNCQKYSRVYCEGWSWDNVKENSANIKTKEVGSSSSKDGNLFDMTGNVWEWCSDWYDSEYYSKSEKENPKGPSQPSIRTERVIKGGSWQFSSVAMRASNRLSRVDSCGYNYLGFRFCRERN